MFFFMLPEKRERLFVATSPSWKAYKLCHALAVSSSLVFAYKANATTDDYEVHTAGKQQKVPLRATISDRIVMVIMQFIEREWQ